MQSFIIILIAILSMYIGIYMAAYYKHPARKFYIGWLLLALSVAGIHIGAIISGR